MPINKKNVVKCPVNELKEDNNHSTSEIPISSNLFQGTLKNVVKCPTNELKEDNNHSTSEIPISSTPQKKSVVKEQEDNQNELIVENLKEIPKNTGSVNSNPINLGSVEPLTNIFSNKNDKLEKKVDDEEYLSKTEKYSFLIKITLREKVEGFLKDKFDDIKNKNFFPDADTICKSLSIPSDQKGSVIKIISNWINENKVLGAINLKDLELKFKGNVNRFELLFKFLNSKYDLIKKGEYIPTKDKICKDLSQSNSFNDYNFNRVVNKWFEFKGLPFKNIAEMKEHFSIYLSVQDKLDKFLDSKINDINNKVYIPTSTKFKEDSGLFEIESPHISKWFETRYNEKKVNFKSLMDLKKEKGMIKGKEVYEFLDSKISQIKDLSFIPSYQNVINKRSEFANIDNLVQLIKGWLIKKGIDSVEELRNSAGEVPMYRKLKKILDPLIDDIENYEFLPTNDNIIKKNNEFADFEYLSIYVSRWLKENEIANNITEYLANIGIKPKTVKLRDFLESKYKDIINGKYFPTINNLRKVENQIGIDVDEFDLATARSRWFRERIGKTMTQLIEEFDPTYKSLGYELQNSGYPFSFWNQKVRVFHALFQIRFIEDYDNLISYNSEKFFNDVKDIFKEISNLNWKFVDILTGEILTLQDYEKGLVILHHINFDKSDLNADNLVFVSSNTHAIITNTRNYHFDALDNLFSIILKENIESLKNNRIPKSWEIGWRKLAMDFGIKLPSNKYLSKSDRPTILNYDYEKNKITKFL